LIESWDIQGNELGTAHPNTSGHAVIAGRIGAAWAAATLESNAHGPQHRAPGFAENALG